MKFLPIFLIVLIIILTLKPKDSTIEPLKPQDTILAFGDSLTYGYNVEADESYPSLLQHLSGHTIINAGILGETSKDGLKRLLPLLENKDIKLMILCFGGNDIMQRLSMNRLKANLKTMIQMAKEKEISILLVSVPNISLFGLSALDLYEEVADEENIPLLTGVLTDILSTPSLKSDQVHPNNKGYKILADKIYEKLKEVGFLK